MQQDFPAKHSLPNSQGFLRLSVGRKCLTGQHFLAALRLISLRHALDDVRRPVVFRHDKPESSSPSNRIYIRSSIQPHPRFLSPRTGANLLKQWRARSCPSRQPQPGDYVGNYAVEMHVSEMGRDVAEKARKDMNVLPDPVKLSQPRCADTEIDLIHRISTAIFPTTPRETYRRKRIVNGRNNERIPDPDESRRCECYVLGDG